MEAPIAPPVRRIVVAFDGSDASNRAVQFALGTVRGPDGGVWIVHAKTAPRLVAEPRTDEQQDSEVDSIAERLRAIQGVAQRGGQHVELWIREGDPPSVIVAAAAEVNADLIVVGTRGLRGPSRILLGSVSTEVLLRAGRPVTVVP